MPRISIIIVNIIDYRALGGVWTKRLLIYKRTGPPPDRGHPGVARTSPYPEACGGSSAGQHGGHSGRNKRYLPDISFKLDCFSYSPCYKKTYIIKIKYCVLLSKKCLEKK